MKQIKLIEDYACESYREFTKKTLPEDYDLPESDSVLIEEELKEQYKDRNVFILLDRLNDTFYIRIFEIVDVDEKINNFNYEYYN